MKHKPPVWADKFLQWYCRIDLLEEIQGDAYEIYYRQAQKNKRLADLHYCWNVIRFFQLKNIRKRKTNNTYVSIIHFMIILKSYFRSGFRNITRHLTHSTINMAGLSLAIGCAISIFLLIDSFYNLDNFHEKGDRLFLLTSEVRSGDETETWARTPYLMGPALKAEQTGVESMVRVQRISDLSIRYNEHVFSENVWAVDSTFFDVFSYPILSGATKPLSDKKGIVLTKKKAVQYFGTADPIDKELSVK
ncbi:MAG: permease prefix domain 2-containing transporter, partial [Cyclobacteriaceae bacterium]|nr:permease prefix domain 2-containing transporter [Cyclobacteriaceae bacterium]